MRQVLEWWLERLYKQLLVVVARYLLYLHSADQLSLNVTLQVAAVLEYKPAESLLDSHLCIYLYLVQYSEECLIAKLKLFFNGARQPWTRLKL